MAITLPPPTPNNAYEVSLVTLAKTIGLDQSAQFYIDLDHVGVDYQTLGATPTAAAWNQLFSDYAATVEQLQVAPKVTMADSLVASNAAGGVGGSMPNWDAYGQSLINYAGVQLGHQVFGQPQGTPVAA